MKVVIDGRHWLASGIGRVTRNLVPELVQELSERGHTAVVLLNAAERNVVVGCEVVCVRGKMYSFTEAFIMHRQINALNADAYLSLHYPVSHLVNCSQFALVHDDLHLTRQVGLLRRVYARYMFSRLRRRACHVFTVSTFTRAQLLLRHGFSAARTSVAYPAIDANFVQPRADSAAGADRPEPFLLFIGNLKPHKNIQCVIEAIEILRSRGREVTLHVVGAGGRARHDSNLVRTEPEGLIFHGGIDDQEMRQLLYTASALVQPSIYEGFGLPPLEAMAHGCPVLASYGGSLPEVCGDAAAYFDPWNSVQLADRVEELLDDPRLRAEMVERGYRRAVAFDWQRSSRLMVDTLEDCIRRPGGIT